MPEEGAMFGTTGQVAVGRVVLRDAACALAALSLLACDGSDAVAKGVLIVPYELGNNRSCDDLGVDTVQADLDDGFIVEEVDCDEGQVRIESVPVGTYNIRVFGLDADGFPVLDSEATGPVKERVIDSSTTTVDPKILLTSAPARLFVRWGFGFSSCDEEGVDHFLIRAWHKEGIQLLLESELNCMTKGEGSESYRRVPDPDRELGGDVLGEVSVQPVDADGNELGDPVVFVFDPPGAGHPVRLSLSDCSSNGCEGSGEPDE